MEKALSPGRLYYFFQEGCAACKAAEKPLLDFKSKHPEVLLIRRDLNRGNPILNWLPRGTPSYLIIAGDEEVHYTGLLGVQDLEDMLAEATGEEKEEEEKEDEGEEE